MSCSEVFRDFLVKCSDRIRLNIILPILPYAAYSWLITDKFGNQFTGTLLQDDDGYFIDLEDLPAGLLTEFSGDFVVKILRNDLECKPTPLLVAKYYDSIEFCVRPGSREKDYLGCKVDCEVAPIGGSVMIPFEDQDIVVIPWTSNMQTLFGDTPIVQVYHEISSGVYQLVSVAVEMDSPLTSVTITNAGPATGYVIIN